jgi:hypothetical protein
VADIPQSPVLSPLQQAEKRLTAEATYVRDLLHLAGSQGQVTLSAVSLQLLFNGLVAALDAIRQAQPVIPPQVAPVPPAP